jgi:hypothetical protein
MTPSDFFIYWAAHYGDAPPLSYHLKHNFSKRWLRLHSLPDSKRYADTPDERAIVLARHNKVMDDLAGEDAEISIIINHIEKESHLFVSFNLEPLGAISAGQGEPSLQSFIWTDTWSHGLFDVLFSLFAYDEIKGFIVVKDYLIAPYDGGIDIIAPNAWTCWALKRKYADWLSKREDGY